MNNIHTSMYGLRRLSSPLMCNYSIIVKTLNTKHISWLKYIWFEFETNEWKIERNWIWILIGFLWEFLLHAVFWVIIFLIYFLHFFDCTRRKNWCFESDFVQFLFYFLKYGEKRKREINHTSIFRMFFPELDDPCARSDFDIWKMFFKKKLYEGFISVIARRSNSFRDVLAAIKAKLKLNTWECDISKNERVEFECQDMNLDLFLVENRLESKLSSNWILWKFHLLVNDVSSCL